jgi:hypothetical protein
MLFSAELTHGTGPPRRQAVGIQGNPQALRQPFFVQCWYQALQITLQQPDLLDMVEQTPADLGRRWRRGAHKYGLANACLEQLDPLGNGRLRQSQDLRGTLETGLLDNSREG